MEFFLKFCDIGFELELAEWCADAKTCPKNCTFSMFRDWFKKESHSLTEDICDYEIVEN